ncbi:MAG: hypothetical protein NUV56_04560 [Candidatus Uhrbacteria bacterium]|nr:hypothetical protein [Candidatus Uhrbacteria bacterium]
MRDDLPTEIKTREDGRIVVNHCFFGHGLHGYWQDEATKLEALGCEIATYGVGGARECDDVVRLNFIVTLPTGTIHEEAKQDGLHPIDIFVLPDSTILSILRPMSRRPCRTLLIQPIKGMGSLLRYGTLSDSLLDFITRPAPVALAA